MNEQVSDAPRSPELEAWLAQRPLRDGVFYANEVDEAKWALIEEIDRTQPSIHTVQVELRPAAWLRPPERLKLKVWTNKRSLTQVLDVVGARVCSLYLTTFGFDDERPDESCWALLNRPLPLLTDLDAGAVPATDEGLAQIAGLPLQRLMMRRHEEGPAGLAQLPASLEWLIFGHSPAGAISRAEVEALAHLKGLKRLEMLSGAFEADALESLPGFAELAWVRLRADADEHLVALGQCAGLRVLDLQRGRSYSKKALKPLAQLTQLIALDLHKDRVNEAGLVDILKANPGLRWVRTLGGGPKDGITAALAGLSGLEVLMCKAKMSDASVPALLKLTTLRSLHLPGSVLSGEGVAQLQALPQLRALGLSGNKAGDALADAVAGFSGLFYADLTRCKVGKKRLAELKEGLPQVRFQWGNPTEVPYGRIEGPPHVPAWRMVY